MPRPSVLIVTPYAAQANSGNWRTAARWARFLRDDYRVIVQAQPAPTVLAGADCLIAQHARRSHAAVVAWRERFAQRPLAVVLTGTDLYRDLPQGDAAALESLALADRLVVLQDMGMRALPRAVRSKAVVIYQSALPLTPAHKARDRIDCVMAGHLREEKDPLTALRAWQYLPPGVPIRLAHIGAARDPALGEAARACGEAEPRYRWLGEKGHAWTRQAIRRAHLLLVPSLVQRFGSALNAHVHFHCCVIDGVFFADPDGKVEFAEAAALTAEDLAAVQQQVRRCVDGCCAGSPAPAISIRPMRATWRAGTTAGVSPWMLRCASKAPTAAGWNGCYAIALARPSHWSGSNRPARSNSFIASPSPSRTGAPSCG
jgi:hypothetical protein